MQDISTVELTSNLWRDLLDLLLSIGDNESLESNEMIMNMIIENRFVFFSAALKRSPSKKNIPHRPLESNLFHATNQFLYNPSIIDCFVNL